ncbi:MAG: TlpA family protein disulfide reductase [Pseudobacter sp.]|uniref:TlpA family protein disulfide reductase n=1 Tax=Pseudobacter sp. TaxID=2045420 RepID=UPI003F7E9DCA
MSNFQIIYFQRALLMFLRIKKSSKRKLLFLLLLSSKIAQSQYANLNPGDVIDNFRLGDVINVNGEKISEPLENSELIILSFWSKTCSACITNMSSLDSLQNQYKGRVRIIPVVPVKSLTNKTKDDIRAFWNTNPHLRNVKLPTAIDTLWYKRLGISGVPTEVWISNKSKILAITSSEYVNKKEIDKILEGNLPNWQDKRKIFLDTEEAIFTINPAQPKASALGSGYSTMTRYLANVQTALGIDSSGNSLRFYAVNCSIPEIYNSILSELSGMISPSKFVPINFQIFAPDSTLYYKPEDEYENEWRSKHSYTFEYSKPKEIEKLEFYFDVLNELNKQFNLTGSLNKKNVIGFTLQLLSENEKRANEVRENVESKKINSSNIKITESSSFITMFNNIFGNTPIIFDETNDKMILQLPLYLVEKKNLEEIKQVLYQNNYRLKVASKELLFYSVVGK